MAKSIAPVAFNFNSLLLRTFSDENQNPWFSAKDVCALLGYRNDSDAIKKHCKDRGVAKRDTPTSSGNQEMTYINEGNLYRLIVKSRKPEAEAFEAWVMEEVLPSIRKTGCYTKQLPKLKYTALKRPSINVADGSRILGEIKSWSRVNLPRERHEELFDALTEVEAVLTKATTEMHEAIAHFNIGIHYLNRFRK